jgi:GTP pyrophosphokinase
LRRLPEGATVLDFAYCIHSEVGSHCVGGTIRNQNVSIRQKLENGDQVSVMTSPNQRLNPDWLNIVVSTKAKNKIRQALKEIEYKQAAEGKEIIERRFKNWKLEYTEADITRMALKLGYKEVSDMYQSVANGKEDMQHLREVLLTPEETPVVREHTEYVDKSDLKGLAIEVDMNVKNVDYNLSKCCNPQPGDPIFAFVSVLKGIRIHRIDCPNAVNIRERYPYRMIPARWAKKS